MFAEKIAKAALEINAIKLNPDKPFTWASGFRMPIYNDNRMLLFHPGYRSMIADGFIELLENVSYDVVAGTSTAGISPATTLADKVNKPLVYIRNIPKGHGLRNQIEGIDAGSNLQNKKVILIEDLISTGGSSARAVQAIRDANGECNYCFSIFNYGLEKSLNAFDDLDEKCEVKSLLTYDVLLQAALDLKKINSDDVKMLVEWRKDPFSWGRRNGFERAIK